MLTTNTPHPDQSQPDAFASRLRQSELLRVRLMMVAYATLLTTTIVRRLWGGVVMADNLLFGISVAICLSAIAVAVAASIRIQRDIVAGHAGTTWWIRHLSWIELAWPAGLMVTLHYLSPIGEVLSLTSPTILMFPLTILSSVMRLRPLHTIFLGCAAAAFHVLLVVNTYRGDGLPTVELPRYISYGVLLVMTGAAGGIVSFTARRYLRDAVDEALIAHSKTNWIRLIERNAETARKIQRAILTPKSSLAGRYDISGLHRPSSMPDGDHVDWETLPDGRCLISISAVGSHGMGAAVQMAVSRAFVRLTELTPADLRAMVARTKLAIASNVADGQAVSLSLASVAADGNMECISAGLTPTIFTRRSDGTFHVVEVVSEQTLGQPSEAECTMQRVHLAGGDVAVILNAGVLELQNATGQQLGLGRISDVLDRLPTASAADLAKEIDQAIRYFVGASKPLDDLTIVIIRRPVSAG